MSYRRPRTDLATRADSVTNSIIINRLETRTQKVVNDAGNASWRQDGHPIGPAPFFTNAAN
jgi:hypothetical protein